MVALGRRIGRLASVAALAWILGGCVRATLVLPVQIAPDLAPARGFHALHGYQSAIRTIADIMVAELHLPLPGRLTVFVYPTRAEFERGLITEGRLGPARAAMIADSSRGLGQPGRFFVNDEALRGAPRRIWLGLVAHELTHLAQYELAGGRRGRSEQWLREGRADWVATWILERVGEASGNARRQRHLGAVGGGDAHDNALDLVALGHPRGWEARLRAAGRVPAYGMAFLLTGELVRQRGFESLTTYFRGFFDTDDRFGNFHRAFGQTLSRFEHAAPDRIRGEARLAPPFAACDRGGTRRTSRPKRRPWMSWRTASANPTDGPR